MPKVLGAQKWLTWLHDINYTIPDYIRQPIARSIRALDEQRAGTVGRHIRELVVSWIDDHEYDD